MIIKKHFHLLLATCLFLNIQVSNSQSAPIQLEPLGNIDTSLQTINVNFKWSSVAGQRYYRLFIYNRTDAKYESTQFMYNAETSFSIPLSTGKSYSWKVRSENGTINAPSPWTPWLRFSINKIVPSATITVINPGCTISVGETRCTSPVSWNASNAPKAGVFVGSNPNFGQVHQPLTNLFLGQKYHPKH